MKIALIFPRYRYPSGDIPLGIAYLAASIRNLSNVSVTIIDTTFHPTKKYLLKVLEQGDYDLIGLSLMTTMIADAVWIVRAIRERNKNVKIIVGGPHPTILPKETLTELDADAVAIGESERTFVEVVNKKGVFKDVAGVWYKKNGVIYKNDVRDPIKNLDDLPFPAFELYDMEKYLTHWFQLDSVKSNLRGINIITSRGCPYQCTYCQPALEKIFGEHVRRRSPKNIVEELAYLKKEFNIDAFMFQDDTFVIDKNWVCEIVDLLIKSKLDLVWGCNARADMIDFETFRMMSNAGLRKVNIGMESGTQRILNDEYNKQIRVSDVLSAVKTLKKLKLKIQGYFMIGALTETDAEINATIRFARKLNIDEVAYSIATPLPGTHLFEKTKSFINKSISDMDYYKNTVYRTKVCEKNLYRLKLKAILSFYFSPRHFLSTLKIVLSVSGIKKTLLKLKRL